MANEINLKPNEIDRILDMTDKEFYYIVVEKRNIVRRLRANGNREEANKIQKQIEEAVLLWESAPKIIRRN